MLYSRNIIHLEYILQLNAEGHEFKLLIYCIFNLLNNIQMTPNTKCERYTIRIIMGAIALGVITIIISIIAFLTF
jgi:hypothetical protein